MTPITITDELVLEAVRSHVLPSDTGKAAGVPYDRFLTIADRLREDRSAAIERVEQLVGSGDSADRAAGADLLGRLAFEAPADIEQRCVKDLKGVLRAENAGPGEVAVLGCVINSFGHIGDRTTLPLVLGLEAILRRRCGGMWQVRFRSAYRSGSPR